MGGNWRNCVDGDTMLCYAMSNVSDESNVFFCSSRALRLLILVASLSMEVGECCYDMEGGPRLEKSLLMQLFRDKLGTIDDL